MHPHGESSEVRLSPTNDKAQRLLDPTVAPEITTITCAVCGKAGVSICAKCSKKGRRYKTALARANPLQERDPELYKRLDEMSRLSLQGNRQVFDEFCIEIKAGGFYEHLPMLVEILQEGKWRTEAWDVRKWLRENLARQVRRSGTLEDYGPGVNARRRPGAPKFDKRSGALTAFAERPFIEFEILRGNGDTISPDEEIEGRIERKRLQTAGGGDDYMPTFPMPADRDSLQFLGRLTFAERLEAFGCKELADALERDRPAFDQALAEAISNQRELVECMGLDQDEAEVLAVIELLWYVGPRMYLNFLDEANKRRIRNAWDRFDRKRKKSEWATLFRQGLRVFARETRRAWRHEYWAHYDRSMEGQDWEHLIPPPISSRVKSIRRDQPQILHPPCTCGALDHRFCTCRRISGPIGGGWANPVGGSMRPDPGNFDGVVRLDCDLPPEEKRVYSAYEKKRNLRNTTIPRKL
jgi:hypothetical protein